MSGSISRLVHLSPTGGAIFRVRPTNCIRTTRVLAGYNVILAPPAPGEYFELTGRYSYDVSSVFGRQFHAETAKRVLPTGQAIIALLMEHPAFVGIGRIRVRRLWSALGPTLADELTRGNESALMRAGLSGLQAARLCIAWHEYGLEVKTANFLRDAQLPLSISSSCLAFWGGEAEERISTNPYCVVGLASWVEVDKAARGYFGISPDDSRRAVAACESACTDAMRNGATAVSASELEARIEAKLGGMFLAKAAIELAVECGRTIRLSFKNEVIYQAIGLSRIERGIFSRIQGAIWVDRGELAASDTCSESGAKNDESLANESHLPSKESEIPRITITCIGLNYPDISEGAKPLLPGNAVHLFACDAMRANAKLAPNTQTLLFRELLQNDGIANHGQFLRTVLHGAAAVDIFLLSRILRWIPCNAHLWLVGDFRQPPPIGPGLFFHLFAEADTRTTGETARLGGLDDVTSRLFTNQGDKTANASPNTTDSRCRFIPVASLVELDDEALACYREAADAVDAVNTLIITSTWRLADAINARLQAENLEMLHAQKQKSRVVLLRRRQRAAVGDVVVYHKYDSGRCLFRGSRGVITKVHDSPIVRLDPATLELTVVVAEASIDTAGLIDITLEDSRFLSLGYAMPLPLSCWSTWSHVVVCIDNSRLINHNWIYNAVARSTERVIVTGCTDALRRALANHAKRGHRVVGLSALHLGRV